VIALDDVPRSPMRIDVSGARGAVDSRTRAYVEYRIFDTLRSVERQLRSAEISLSDESMELPRIVTCTIALEFTSGERITASATADWPYAAVDRAVRNAWRHVSARPQRAMTPL
jgi:ribosome-associated translation inhibitor RaiA